MLKTHHIHPDPSFVYPEPIPRATLFHDAKMPPYPLFQQDLVQSHALIFEDLTQPACREQFQPDGPFNYPHVLPPSAPLSTRKIGRPRLLANRLIYRTLTIVPPTHLLEFLVAHPRYRLFGVLFAQNQWMRQASTAIRQNTLRIILNEIYRVTEFRVEWQIRCPNCPWAQHDTLPLSESQPTLEHVGVRMAPCRRLLRRWLPNRLLLSQSEMAQDGHIPHRLTA